MNKEDKKKKTSNFNFKSFYEIYITRFLLIFAISFIFFIVYFVMKEETIIAALDGLFYAFVISFAAGAFSWLTNLGFFDIFAYNAIRLKEYWFKNIEKSHFYGTYDYTKSKKDKRDVQKFIPLSYIASSFIFLIGTIIVYIIYKTCI